DVIAFAAFVSFFPQLVAGPIERAATLLPQILNKRVFDKAQQIEGVKLVIYGFFLKLVIADTLAPIVNDIFANHETVSGGTLILGLIFLSFQVYGDFAGYSKIARGLAKMFGMELMLNFHFPYFSRNIGEFWRRWHISLTTWFRDYLYIPVGGSRGGKAKSIRNIYIIFLVSGLWHGASWVFIIWGFIHATVFLPSYLTKSNRKFLADDVGVMDRTFLENLSNLGRMFWTYSQIAFITLFFRAEDLNQALTYIANLNFHFDKYLDMLVIVLLALIVDAILYMKLEKADYFYPILLGAVIAAGLITEKAEFVYFQF
ncbi:MAG: MBOAT family O-acyltransferase, partial [Bacteroidota bacterium]